MHARYIMIALACAAMAGTTACNSNAKDELAHHHHDHGHGHDKHEHEGHDHEGHEGHDHEGHEGHDHGSGDEIILEPAQAKAFGVTTQKVEPGAFSSVIKVSGRILAASDAGSVVTAPLAGVVTLTGNAQVGRQVNAGTAIASINANAVSGGNANAAAAAALKAAEREVERMKPLHAEGIVSTADYNAVLNTLAQAKALYSSRASSGVASAVKGGTVTQVLVQSGQFVEAGTPIATIASSNNLTLQADVPDKYVPMIARLSGVRIRTASDSEVVDLSSLGAKKVSNVSSVSLQPGYVPVFYSFTNNGRFVAGMPVEAYLLSDTRDNVISVPVSALSEQQGNYYVYVKVDDEGYLKSPVTLGQNDGMRVEITHGLHAGDQVVVSGVTTVRLAEKSGVVPEGHSHNH